MKINIDMDLGMSSKRSGFCKLDIGKKFKTMSDMMLESTLFNQILQVLISGLVRYYIFFPVVVQFVHVHVPVHVHFMLMSMLMSMYTFMYIVLEHI